MALNGWHSGYGGVYRAACQEVLTDRVRVQIPQLFASEMVTIFECAGPRPQAGDQGWVSFESGLAEHPVWMGSESKGSTSTDGGGGGGSGDITPIWAPYKVKTIPVSFINVTGGNIDMGILDATETASFDGWIEVSVGGGYARGGAVDCNARQGIYCATYADPDGQGWLSFGEMVTAPSGVWDLIGGCQLNIPVGAGNGHNVWWRGNWAPSGSLCSFRSSATVKYYSLTSQPVNQGPRGPQGPPGDTPQAIAFRFVQTTAATVWLITHNLPFYPNVMVVDSAGDRILPGDIAYLSSTTIRLTFSAAVGGEAFLS